ncbi:hypothetical protein D6D01_03976 [Aureobasidium pullulans]|uniref:Uncharacterized protein n=1 Tax=Aureobasidium pullulans TaxID=5580 RepID=A0A4V4JW65_AURPU|nr:hypothetical protein D6D01_03976 [Aureobasidium pullulans]
MSDAGLTRKQQIIEKLEENDAERGQDKPEAAIVEEDEAEESSSEELDLEDEDSIVPSKRAAEPTESAHVKRTKTKHTRRTTGTEKPRLTTPYNKTTPLDDFSCPDDLKAKYKTEFEVRKPDRPSHASQEYELYDNEALMNPLSSHREKTLMGSKGPGGSTTYDTAGFEIDYQKLVDGTNQPMTKHEMISNMDRSIEKDEKEKKEMFELFFLPDEHPEDDPLGHEIENFVKDQVSKDIGVPWHQIGPKHVEQWLQKGHEKVAFKSWWKDPNEEEMERMDNMTCGCVFRKDL